MTDLYLRAKQSQVSWGLEGTPYSKAADVTSPLGLVIENITWPNANPLKRESTAGGIRGIHTLSKEEWALKFGLGFQVLNNTVPFACAIGTASAISGTGYTGTRFTTVDADILSTVTIERCQKDAALIEDYIGCKADLVLSARKNGPLNAQMDVLASKYDEDTAASSFPTVTVPTTQPYRFWMLGEVTLDNGGTVDTTLANINAFEIAFKNGLEQRGHSGAATRGAYCIVETEVEGRLAAKLGVTIANNNLLKWAIADEAAIDVVIPFLRAGTTVKNCTDGVIITLNDCRILEAPIPTAAKGDVQTEMILAPISAQVDIRVPA